MGEFELLVDKGYQVMQVSYFGYQTEEKELNVHSDIFDMNFKLTESAINLDDVVITATKTEKSLKEVPVITKLITVKDLEKKDAVDIKDILLTEIPGIEFSSMGGGITIKMQGLDGKYVLFLVDGERMAGETEGSIDFNRLDANNIERIEVVKGASSALYGSSAMAGVVNIITKTNKDKFNVKLNSRYGSFNEYKLGGTIGFKEKNFSSTTYLSEEPISINERKVC